MSDLDKARQVINEVDREIVRLFEKRMDAVCQVAEYKRKFELPVEDIAREDEVIQKNTEQIVNDKYRPYYLRFLRSMMQTTKDFQRDEIGDTLFIKTGSGGYPIHFGRGSLHKAGEVINLDRKVLIVTDTGVPEEYVMTIASQCTEAVVFVFEQGEKSKNIETYCGILETLTQNTFTRTDCIVAVGGGVVGDMAGFAASTYMRGIDFYNVPTTVLSQVDSSVGGKTAIDFMGFKNLVGAFYPPKGVLIDPDVLRSLPDRQISNGLAEAVKMALTHDAELFSLFEKGNLSESVLDEIILRAIQVKKMVVEADEREAGQRKALNFGHTLGHAFESITTLFHGECVALGMLPMCADDVRQRLIQVLNILHLPTQCSCDYDALIEICRHDKKVDGNNVTIVTVPEIGRYELATISFEEYEKLIREAL